MWAESLSLEEDRVETEVWGTETVPYIPTSTHLDDIPVEDTERNLFANLKNMEFQDKTGDMINKIKMEKDYNDPKSPDKVKQFVNCLRNWDIQWALSVFFDFVKGTMWDGWWPEWTFWFKESEDITNFIGWLSMNADKLTIEHLEKQKDRLREEVNQTSGTKRKLWLTYALSRVLDHITWKRAPNLFRWSSDEAGACDANTSAIGRMAQRVKPWDILAINKSKQKAADKLLTQLVDDDMDTSHVLIVTNVDASSGEITVAHSTISKMNSRWSGVETGVSLAKYTEQFHAVAIAALQPPDNSGEELVRNVLQKNGRWYDKMAPISTAFLGDNIFGDNNKYNCVELIAQSFPDTITSSSKNWTHPSQMLQNLTPSYVTIAGKSIGWS